MSFTIKNPGGTRKTLVVSCLQCPYSKVSFSHNRTRMYCIAEGRIILEYGKRTPWGDVWKKFWKIYGQQSLFPPWCPIGTGEVVTELDESFLEKKANNEDSDFVSIF